MTLPVAVLDHVVVNARDSLDELAETYRRLGFTLTPRGRHTLGSSNHLAVFGTDYLELVGVEPGPDNRTDVLDWPPGLNGIVFKTYDAEAVYGTLQANGVPVLPVQALSRPVQTPSGPQDAAFRTVRITRDAAPSGRLYFCQHLTPGLVWDDAVMRHPNGAVGVKRAVIAAANPVGLLTLFSQMFGSCTADGKLTAGHSHIDVVTPGLLHTEFGDCMPNADGRQQFMAALMIRTASLEHTAAALLAGGIASKRHGNTITVAARDAGGVTVVFGH